jgi:hypothetical protein
MPTGLCRLSKPGVTVIKILRDMWTSLEQPGRIAMMILVVIMALLLARWGYLEFVIGLL